jgi:hypothetical protein
MIIVTMTFYSYCDADNQIDTLLKDEIFGPICPVIKSDFRSAYTATKQ